MKIVKSLVIALLFIVIAGGIAAGIFFGITSFFDISVPGIKAGSSSDENKNSNAQVIGVTDTGKKVYAGGTYSMPEALTIIDIASSEEESASDKEFTMSFPAPKNPYINYEWQISCSFLSSGDWELDQNASEYLKVVSNGDDTAQVKMNAPFNSPIIISAISSESSTVYTCRVDCLVSIEGVRPFLVDCDFGETISAGFDLLDEYCGNQLLGTVLGEIKITKAAIVIEENFIDYFKSYLDFDVTVSDYIVPESVIAESSVFSDDERYGAELVLCLEYSMFIEDFDSFDEEQQTAICQAWFSAYMNYKRQYNADFYVDVQNVYNGIVAESYTGVCMGWTITGYERGYVELPEPEYEDDEFLYSNI